MSLAANLLSFAVVAGLMTITPGLDTAMVLRSAISQGRWPALATALGINSGILVWAAAAAVGISALLTASEVAYTAVKLAGAAYMLWLGFGMLRSAWKGDAGHTDAAPTVPAQTSFAQTNFAGCYRRGLLTNLLNPKVGAFYVALLPQFMPPEGSHLLAGLLLGGIHALEGLLWLSLLAFTADRARALLARPGTVRAVDGVAGLAVVGFGLKLGLSRH